MANVILQLEKDMQERVKRNPQLWSGTKLSISQADQLKFPDDFKLHPSAGIGKSPCSDEIVPPFPSRPTVINTYGLAHESLEIVDMLAGGFGHLSQTYLCKTNRGAHHIVLKLFQQEYMPYPAADWGLTAATLDEVYKDWPQAEKLYSAEALAYERLRVYRGTRLPYSYGFYRTTLPSGDITIGHLMEYIISPLPYELENAESIDWIDFLKQFVDCLLEFRRYGVEHSDIAARNIRAFKSEERASWEFILLDWASANFEWDRDFGFKNWHTITTLALDLQHLVIDNPAGNPERWLHQEGRHVRALLLDRSRHQDVTTF